MNIHLFLKIYCEVKYSPNINHKNMDIRNPTVNPAIQLLGLFPDIKGVVK